MALYPVNHRTFQRAPRTGTSQKLRKIGEQQAYGGLSEQQEARDRWHSPTDVTSFERGCDRAPSGRTEGEHARGEHGEASETLPCRLRGRAEAAGNRWSATGDRIGESAGVLSP